jgi:lipoprotein-releasing system ATP-binding protein
VGNADIILEARGVSCSRAANAGPLAPVRDVSLSIRAGTLTLLAGDGQGGENLLLRLLGLLETPDAGEILFRGGATAGLSGEARAELRNQRFGFLFAEPFLLPSFSVVENVAMPLFKISGVGAEEARKRTEAMLEFAGMADLGDELVGGLAHAQQQRVSLARALVNEPEVLIVENADAELDGEEQPAFNELIRRANAEFGATTILTAADCGQLHFTGRVIELAGGAIVRDSQSAVESGGGPA